MTQEASHTPGPWATEQDINSDPGASPLCIVTNDYIHIADVQASTPSIGSRPKWETAEANARLIAVAPDLLAALQKIESELIDVDMEVPEYVSNAIAKATK